MYEMDQNGQVKGEGRWVEDGYIVSHSMYIKGVKENTNIVDFLTVYNRVSCRVYRVSYSP